MKTANKDLNYKLGLLKLAIELNNVSLACKIFGCSRPTHYPGYLGSQDTHCIKGVKQFIYKYL